MATPTHPKSMARIEAYRVIKQHQTLKLNIEDSETFVDALLNPPKPNDALKAVAVRYKQIMSA